jgi:hypothetical protein
MERSIKAAAICRFFAARKDRAIVSANTNDRATLHAHFAQAFYSLCESLRGLLSAGSGNTGVTAMTWHATTSQHPWCSRMSGLQPCMVVRRVSPEAVVVA